MKFLFLSFQLLFFLQLRKIVRTNLFLMAQIMIDFQINPFHGNPLISTSPFPLQVATVLYVLNGHKQKGSREFLVQAELGS